MIDDLEIDLFHIRETMDETLGVFQIGYRHIWTIEDPYKDNIKNVSRIPSGRYFVRLEKSNTCKSIGLGVAYTILNVPGNRTQIRFMHPANDENDVSGCVGGGFGVDWINGEVLDSKMACRWFYDWMDKHHGLNPFWLNIIDKVRTT